MGKTKTHAGRRVFNGILLVLDLALLVWIVHSWRGQRNPVPAEDYDAAYGYGAGGYTSYDGGSGEPAGDGSPDASADNTGGSLEGNVDNWLLGLSGGDEAPEEDRTAVRTADRPADRPAQGFVPLEAAGRPESDEFEAWKSQGGTPAGARTITDFGGIGGTWKGFILYDGAEEMVSFSVSGTEASLTFTVDWYLIHYAGDGSWENEEDMEDTVYTGKWSDGVLTAEGTGSFRIDSFYEADGKQYARGELTTPAGGTAAVGMMRP